MSAESAKGQGEDQREDAGLEEESDRQESYTCFSFEAYRKADECDTSCHETKEDKTRFDKHCQAGGDETTDGEDSLSDSKPIRGL